MTKKILSLLLAALILLSIVPAATANDGYGYNGKWRGEVISRQVTLYKEANSSSGSVRKVQNGVEFDIMEKKGNWVYAAVPKEKGEGYDYGWIMVQYVIENPTHIVLRDNSGVYAYAAPYNTDKRVGTVADYERFTVIATTGNYYIVSFRQAVCYLPMNADYWVEEDIEAIVNGPSTPYTVNANNTRVYGYASTKHGYIDTFKAGTQVDLLYVQDGYGAISYKNVIAFIEMSKLTPAM